MFAVALTALALTGTAASVPVSGGTAAERTIIRRALRGADPGVTTFARIERGRKLVIGPPAAHAPGVSRGRESWQAPALLATIQAALNARGDALASYEITGDTWGSFGTQSAPSLGPPGAQRLRARVLSRARAAGLDVRDARVLAIGGGVLEITIRLREDQLLDTPAQVALTTLFGTQGAGVPHFLAVEAPDGTAVAYGGTFTNGGMWSYGGDTGNSPVPRAIPTSLSAARTDLMVRLTQQWPTRETRSFHFVCGHGVAALGDCRRLLADRWALFVPAPGWQCLGPLGGWTVSVHGVFASQKVDRQYDTCYGATTGRWARFLGL